MIGDKDSRFPGTAPQHYLFFGANLELSNCLGKNCIGNSLGLSKRGLLCFERPAQKRYTVGQQLCFRKTGHSPTKMKIFLELLSI